MRATVVFVTALLVVGVVAPFAAAASTTDGLSAATDDSVAMQDDDATNETGNGTAPGAKLAGVADVQGAEVEGEVETRAFGLQVAAANSNASKASVVAQQAQSLETRLADLQDRRAELEAARENGSIPESRYRAEIAGLVARISTLQRLSNATADTTKELPAEALAERGVNASAIEHVRSSAGNLSGPEVASIARNITGPPNGSAGPPANVGGPPGDVGGPPGNAGPGENTTNDGGPGVGAGNGNGQDGDDVPGSGNGQDGDDVPGNGQNATTGQNNTTGGPGQGADKDNPADNATDGNGPDAPGNGTDNPGNSTDVVENETDTTVDDDVVDGLVSVETSVRLSAAGPAPPFAGEWSVPDF